ncbi:L-glutaminase [Roseovarius marisflavi]|uniref:Glutaminase n=2 Tax=Roseovarius marisflavi TaxID=1054996 RepID=A0A1M7A5N3_9RHOB|nr:L-glutaminase [Roseovarius marisflavi]
MHEDSRSNWRHNFLDGHVPSPIQSYLDDLLHRMLQNAQGEVATYIPELGKADPEALGICITMADGTIYTSGECDTEFTIQSMSKPFTYGQALKLRGPEAVLKRVGVEPTGEAFNAIILDEEKNRPFNPMVNAGAISVANLLLGPASQDDMLSLFSNLAGRSLTLNESVYRSKIATGHRNRAIAYMMLNTGMIDNDPEEVLKLYFQQCSIDVTCQDMAMMGATLANLGVNPKTGVQVIEPNYVQSILTLMNTCGMYDYAGQWAFEVGIPAKSGVAGGIIAVIPGQAGISVWSPRLDEHGNSVRGVAVCQELSRRFGLHVFGEKAHSSTVIRRSYPLGEICSKRIRSLSERAFLTAHGSKVMANELQGTLYFASAEMVIRRLTEGASELSDIIVDFSRVHNIDDAAAHLLMAAFDDFLKQGRRIRLSGMRPELPFSACIKEKQRDLANLLLFPDLDDALEAAENKVLEGHFEEFDTAKYEMSKLDLLRGLSDLEYGVLENLVRIYSYGEGEKIVSEGDDAASFYIIANGLADVVINMGEGRNKRLASLGPGASFGELALVEGGRRTADVIAAQSTMCYVFPVEGMLKAAETHPNILIKLLCNMVGNIASRLKHANDEIRGLQ